MKNREGCHFSLLKGSGFRKKKKIYNLFPRCRWYQKINSTRLQTHSSKATFLSPR